MTSAGDGQAELRALREDNEALRYSSLKFGELSERLSERVRELEQRLQVYQRLWVIWAEQARQSSLGKRRK